MAPRLAYVPRPTGPVHPTRYERPEGLWLGMKKAPRRTEGPGDFERRQGFKARTGQEMSPGNVWLAGRLQEQDALGRIIVRIELTRLADGSVHALRGAGVAARTDAITAEMDGSHHGAR